ncbi:hypothetical protein EMIHUDRAFT_219754 [Emiliania huxleyi CCMP1516]|uniref:CS domain-containing protein n=2 Tax=Emiliania huxleyi TaxID=2903 RepID=A0A0D3I413_EMIH1|nr:hypothetical protein EMIHUDRAFT_219754 [Emiliania huxleyi CCMP1516]EOD05998.1 hypothetical protein EMIHUDRAFT_219754 [Emiliania huxleyi CCMP1516]|eukprot:XP_005758427.1 hypothetical protein EMIHUDRAFT_219754 [Emiliania huxleyi CCMP1516]
MAALAAAGFLGRAPASNDLEAQAVALLDRIAALEAVPGAARLQRRVESELDAVRGDDSSGSRLLGAANNLIAVEFELDVWAWAPDGVSLSKTVRPPGQSAATIDVVAAGGAWRVPDHVHLQTHVHEPRWLVGDALPLESGETERLALAAVPALLGECPSGG